MSYLCFAAWGIVIFSLLFGILFLFFSKVLARWSAFTSRVLIEADQKILKFRVGVGICLLFIGITSLFLIYYYAIKLK